MNKSLSIIFAFFPILSIYETGIIPVLSIGQILLILYFLAFCINNRLELQFPAFVLYSICITMACMTKPGISINESLHELLAFILFFSLFSFVVKAVVYKDFLCGIKFLGFLSLYFFYVQYILSFVGIKIIGIVPGIPLSNGSDPAAFHSSHLLLNRLSSIFQEPAHFAQFMSMFLSIVLYKYKNTRNNLLLSLFISLAIILCKSAGGYVLLIICWASWGYRFIKNKKNKARYILLSLVLMSGIIFLVVHNSSTNSVIERYQTLSTTPENSEYGYSSYIRLFRGYIPFIEGNIAEMIFGHGIGTLLSFNRMNPNSLFLTITDYDANWINSFQFILFGTGIIGTSLFFMYLIRLYKRTSALGKNLCFVYLATLLSTGILLTASSMLFLYVIYIERKHRRHL